MSAGLGFKDFSTGEVLTAADVDGYLMQGIWVFTNAAARDAAVTSPQEGNACYLKDTDVIQVYTGSAWAAQSASNPISANIVDAKGDIIAATAADTVSKLSVGANNTVLTADSSTATGLKWATASSGGMTLLSTTTLSGSATTVSSISASYKNLYILIVGVNCASASVIRLLPNSDGTLVDSAFTTAIKDVSVTSGANWSDVFMIGSDTAIKAGDTNNVFVIQIYDYANSSQYKLGDYSVAMVRSVSDKATNSFGNGRIKTTSAISSIQVTSGTGNFNGGTMYIYGVN